MRMWHRTLSQGAFDADLHRRTSNLDPLVEAIEALTEEVRGPQTDVQAVNSRLELQHLAMMGQVSEQASEVCSTIAIWSPT